MNAPDSRPPGLTGDERARLRRAFELLPKVEGHGDTALERHGDVLPEWIMEIIANPYRSDEAYTQEGERRTILTGRVTESRRWIMEHTVKYPATRSKPPAIVEYYSEPHILFIWTGQKSAAGEEFASDIIVHYDKDEDDEPSFVVAIHIDSAELLLRPFADKILAKYGVWREPESEQEREERRKRKAALEAAAKYPIWKSPPPARVKYFHERDSLLFDSGRVSAVGIEMAENIIVHYDRDEPDAPSSAVTIRIDSAEHVLKPYVDAILAKYGVKRDSETTDGQARDHIGVPGN